MSVEIHRIVLECQTAEEYQAVVNSRTADSSSWVTASLLHSEARLGQELRLSLPPSNAGDAATSISFRVCDTIPWKSGKVTIDTIVVVVPPLIAPEETGGHLAVESRPLECVRFNTGGMEWVLVLATPEHDEAVVTASRAFMSAIGGQCSAVVAVSDKIYFPISRISEAQDDELCQGFRMYLRVPSTLLVGFLNLSSGSASVSSTSAALRVPLDQFRCVMMSEATTLKPNEEDSLLRFPTLLPDDNERVSEAIAAQKLLLVPALHDTVMQQWYGEHYAELFAEAIRLAAPKLHLHCVYEDGVLMLPLPTMNTSPPDAPYTQVLASVELLAYTVKTRITTASVASGLFTRGRLDEIVAHVMPCRVAIVGSKAMQGWGVMATVGSKVTEIVMGASSTNPLCRDSSLDSTVAMRPFTCLRPLTSSEVPLAVSPMMSAFSTSSLCCRVVAEFSSARNRLRHALALRKSKKMQCHHYITVIHGSPDNLPFEQTLTACVMQGAIPVVMDCRAVDVVESFIVKRLQALVLEPSPSVVIVRHAEILLAGNGGSELQQFLTAEIAAKSCPLYVLHVILLSECTESSPNSKLSSLSTSSPLKATVPNDREREAIARALISRGVAEKCFELSRFVSYDTISEWTVGLSFSDVISFVHGSIVSLLADLSTHGPVANLSIPILGEDHLQGFLKSFQKAQGHNLASTKLQPVRWSDVGGLEEAKREILETIQLPITHPELFAAGMKRRAGILLYGPPGCGKTLLAKAVATEMNINFISVKGPELINQYVGESERNVRNLFQRARDNAPCIVFFDELDALVPARGAKGDAGGAMDRIVAQLLVEVDGVSSAPAEDEMDEVEKTKSTKKGLAKKDIFIIGATNRPDLLDPALLRPGRFDRLTYLGLPANKSEQLFAVKALTRKFSLAGDVNLEEVVAPLPFAYTGADFFALCSDAMMLAVDEVVATAHARIAERAKLQVGAEDGDDDDDEATNDVVLVRQQHFLEARSKLKPSVSTEDLRKYEALKATFGQQSKQ